MSLLQTILRNLANTPREFLLSWMNMSIIMGLTFLVIILLRPGTNRILKPGHRVILWILGWTTWIGLWYARLGSIKILPFTFRTLAIPRAEGTSGLDAQQPAFLPAEIEAGVENSVILPGGLEFSFVPQQWLLDALWVVGLILLVFTFWWLLTDHRRTRHLCKTGRLMTPEELVALNVDIPAETAVRLCDDIPTSFVRLGHDTGKNDGIRRVIYLQSSLPEHRLRLVLLHETEHIRQQHLDLKMYLTLALMVFWWNPALWLAHRLTCRDMELACDEGVLKKLSPEERREYARTLVDLASGKHMWGNMTCFGECDAAIRVRRVAEWEKPRELGSAGSMFLLAIMVLFFYTGALDIWGDPVQEYALSPGLTLDLRHAAGDEDLNLQEIWVRAGSGHLTGGQVMALDREGNWYECYLDIWRDNAGRHCEMESVILLEESPDLTYYTKEAEYRGKN